VQVSDAECTYDAPQMAELLFSDASPAYVLSAHRLLRDDRTLFRQVGRLPPRYEPRAAAEVEALRVEHATLAEVMRHMLALLQLIFALSTCCEAAEAASVS